MPLGWINTTYCFHEQIWENRCVVRGDCPVAGFNREGKPSPAEAGGTARNRLLQKRTVAVQIETDQSKPCFFIFRHRVARSMPRISAARVRTPPVI